MMPSSCRRGSSRRGGWVNRERQPTSLTTAFVCVEMEPERDVPIGHVVEGRPVRFDAWDVVA